MGKISIHAQAESWPLASPFVIARGSKTHAQVVTVKLTEGANIGWGECVPYARYGESVESVLAQINSVRAQFEDGMSRTELHSCMPAGAARNALDCALWDLEAKRAGKNVYALLGKKMPVSVASVQTVSLGTPDVMRTEATTFQRFPVIKIKLDAEDVLKRTEAVHLGAPNAKIIIDANESWSLALLNDVAPSLAALGVVMVEQPLKAGDDAELLAYRGPVPLGADESCHTSADLLRLKGLYQFVNIKLDKAGGLTEALAMQAKARDMEFGVMVGSMVATSLALIPAVLLAMDADYVDLDSSNLLAKDRPGALTLQDGTLSGITGTLWGGGGRTDKIGDKVNGKVNGEKAQ